MKKALIFLSCGQRDEERKIANEIENIIKNEFGMDCYNAVSSQGFYDVDSIIDRLSKADYYLFIDFKREDDIPISIFTHQEFALAKAWKINEILAFQEEGLESEGMLKYLFVDPTKFNRTNLLDIVRNKINKKIENKEWDKYYFRNLIASDIKSTSDFISYKDHTGSSQDKIWHLVIKNNRSNRAAVNTIAILHSIKNYKNGKDIDLIDNSYLKWEKQFEGYQHTILPENWASVDAFAIRDKEQGIFLHSRQDWIPRRPVIENHGNYIFTYHIYSADFPLLVVPVYIKYEGTTSNASLKIEIFSNKLSEDINNLGSWIDSSSSTVTTSGSSNTSTCSSKPSSGDL